MHMLICAIVYAKDEDTALEEAQSIFETLVEHSCFDYYATLDKEGMGVTGKDRWNNIPAVVKADSEEGKKLIKDGMEYTKEAFIANLGAIRWALGKRTDEELFEDGNFKAPLFWAGMHEGRIVWLYDNHGAGIRDSLHLGNVLNKWEGIYGTVEQNPHRDDIVFVVPADVHF